MLKMTELIKNQGKINMLSFEDEVVVEQTQPKLAANLKVLSPTALKSAPTAAINHLTQDV
jgi:hypothetical protein